MKEVDYSTLPPRFATLPKRRTEVANMAAFARASGIPRRTLERVAAGKSNPSLVTCQRIVDALAKLRPTKKVAPEQAAA